VIRVADTLSSGLPLHRQISRMLESRIINGLYAPGSVIPSEARLCEEFGTSRITVRQSLSGLVERGLLKRYRGRGTVVNESLQPVGQPASTGYLEDVLLFFAATRVAGCERQRIPASVEVAEQLGIGTGSPVAVIVRWRTLGGEPFCISSTYLEPALADRITDADLARSTFIEMLEQDLGARLSGAHQVLSAANADEQLVRQLGLTPGAAVFCLTLVYYSADDKAVAFTRTSFRGDRYAHHVRLGRVPGSLTMSPPETIRAHA
jgi:GntR family transcriptional regulator